MKYSSGPNNSLSSIGLADNLREIGFEIGRFKTGTPPRVLASSIDYDKTEIQPGDEAPNHFSFMSSDEDYLKDQIPCWLTYTTENSHTILRDNLHRAPLFSGIVKGVGPRYCPSIEDKITRFADKPRHQLFLEPEGRNTEEVYIGGLSTSMPEDVQFDLVKSIPGLENAEFVRYGVMHRNSYMDSPNLLKQTFQSRKQENLFFAGQMTGVEGYVESAASGLVAGINAAKLFNDEEVVIFPKITAIGSLPYYITHTDSKHFQPMNVTFGIVEELDGPRIRDKKERYTKVAERSLNTLTDIISKENLA